MLRKKAHHECIQRGWFTKGWFKPHTNLCKDTNRDYYYNYYLLQLGCYLVAVVILYVYKT